MIRENIKERVIAEKEIRESIRSQRGGPGAGGEGGEGGGAMVGPAAVPSHIPRSNLIINLTGEDNVDRLSNLSRSSFYGGPSLISPAASMSIPIPGAHGAPVVNPLAMQHPARALSTSSSNSIGVGSYLNSNNNSIYNASHGNNRRPGEAGGSTQEP